MFDVESLPMPTAEQATGGRESLQTDPPRILTLPAELLSIIVEAVAECDPPRFPVSPFDRENITGFFDEYLRARLWEPVVQGGSLGWIKLTHVCRMWREHISESMPLLWSQLIGYFYQRGALDVMLRRAGDVVPLSITCGPNDVSVRMTNSSWWLLDDLVSDLGSPADCQIYRSRIQSIRVINLSPHHPSISRDPPPSIFSTFAQLRVVEVHCLYLRSRDLDEDRFIDDTLMITSPNLREARFTNYILPWATTELTHLSLVLDEDEFPGGLLISIFHLIARTIEVLEIDSCLPINYFKEPRPVFSFPRLHQLHIRDRDEWVNPFMQVFYNASVTKLNFTLKSSSLWPDQAGPAIRSALRLLRYDVDRPLQFLAVTEESCAAGLNLSRDYVRLTLAQEGPSPGWSAHTACFDLSLAIENQRHFRNKYHECVTEMLNVAADTISNIWNNIVDLELNLPLWKHFTVVQCLINKLSNLRCIRLSDPMDPESLLTQATKTILFPQGIFGPFIPRLDKLWIVQSGEWTPDVYKLVLRALAEALASAISLVNNNYRADVLIGRFHIVRLRLDIVQQSGEVQSAWEPKEDLMAMFGMVAEKVELRFL
ncbi:unnamed protein product [Peniophora sp. CBMAI 1063]|nr:unnamed protein product [Peniophora sp. CBMAI 1063]